mmetsp:Transcript_8359/g.18743  ORF Transcript_8359/g.18743 Transcript_8359/m.18743 type:complete len:228 (-) Transcript_8359:228-911(-)
MPKWTEKQARCSASSASFLVLTGKTMTDESSTRVSQSLGNRMVGRPGSSKPVPLAEISRAAKHQPEPAIDVPPWAGTNLNSKCVLETPAKPSTTSLFGCLPTFRDPFNGSCNLVGVPAPPPPGPEATTANRKTPFSHGCAMAETLAALSTVAARAPAKLDALDSSAGFSSDSSALSSSSSSSLSLPFLAFFFLSFFFFFFLPPPDSSSSSAAFSSSSSSAVLTSSSS